MEVHGQFHAPATLPLSKELMLPIGGDGLQSWSGQSAEEKNLLPLRELNHNFSLVQHVV